MNSDPLPIINADILVSACDKQWFRTGSDGKRRMDIKLIPSKNAKGGVDYMVVQRVTEEARLAGIRGPILGNARIVRPKADEKNPFEDDSIPA